MTGGAVPDGTLQIPRDHHQTDLFLWHQYQGKNTNDCAAFSIAIVANAVLNRPQFEGFQVAREMEKLAFIPSPLPHLALRKVPRWAAFPWGISSYLHSKNIPARLYWFASPEQLLRNIREDRFTIVILGDLRKGWGHAKVLYGYEPDGPRPERGFYFVDPGYPREWSRPHQPQGVFWQNENEFKLQWNSLFRLLIEIRS